MVSQKVVIKNPTGLHLRPAGILCKVAMQYKSLITQLSHQHNCGKRLIFQVKQLHKSVP